MRKKYETRNKIIKWFTILVIVAFLITIVGSGIVAFIGTSSIKNQQKQEIMDTLNKPTKKITKEVNNENSNIPTLIQTGN